MYEAYLAHHAEREGFERVWDLDDVDAAFGAITPLKYQQTLQLQGGSFFQIAGLHRLLTPIPVSLKS